MNQGFEYAEFVGPDAAGEPVLDYLARHYPRFSRTDWASRIADGRVTVDGQPAAAGTRLRPGQRLAWLRPPWREPEAPLCFALLYRDEHLLAIAKPSGLPTLPGAGFFEHTLLWLVRRSYPGASPVHRLGRGTSGIVLFARTTEASRLVSQAWQREEVLKVYRALVSGEMETDRLSVEVPIGPVPHKALGYVYAATPAGKPSRSRIRVLGRRGGRSLVEVRIATGRPHQVRIHMAAAGYPLVGDPFYIAGGIPGGDSQSVPGDTGYLLHAERLGLMHPCTGDWLEISCMPPPDLRSL